MTYNVFGWTLNLAQLTHISTYESDNTANQSAAAYHRRSVLKHELVLSHVTPACTVRYSSTHAVRHRTAPDTV